MHKIYLYNDTKHTKSCIELDEMRYVGTPPTAILRLGTSDVLAIRKDLLDSDEFFIELGAKSGYLGESGDQKGIKVHACIEPKSNGMPVFSLLIPSDYVTKSSAE